MENLQMLGDGCLSDVTKLLRNMADANRSILGSHATLVIAARSAVIFLTADIIENG